MKDTNSTLPLPITNAEYNRIVHLTYISAFTDKIEEYMDLTVQDARPPSLLERISTPTHDSSPPTNVSVGSNKEEDPNHPGGDWIKFDINNTKHYPLVFRNEDGREELAQYIRYLSLEDGIVLQGRRTKYTAIYRAPLHARPFPHANFNGNEPRDTDLAPLHPSAPNRIIIDDALFQLGDKGVIADVHTLRAQYLRIAEIKRQRTELLRQELKCEEKKLEAERYLAHAAVRTRLIPHLTLHRPSSPPPRLIPRIFAAQGPSDRCEGEDSLEQRRVVKPRTPPKSLLGKRKERLPPYPYCLKCHSEDPGHDSSDCPYTRSCRYCWSTYHRHHECPSPHLACSTTKCVVPLYHFNVGTVCATSLLAGDDSYESRVAAGDYDGDLEGNVTD